MFGNATLAGLQLWRSGLFLAFGVQRERVLCTRTVSNIGTLCAIIKKDVAKGTHVFTDGWCVTGI